MQFQVSTPAMGYSAGAMAGAATDFDTHLATATAVVNRIVGVTWTGAAADAFLEEWNAFLTSTGATRDALVSISTRLYAAQGGYEANEASVVAAARSSNIRGSMPGSSGGSSGGSEAGGDDRDGSVQA